MPKTTKKETKKTSKKKEKSFFKNFKGELKKVIWLTPKQVVNNTIAVLTIVIITAIIVALLDICFEKANVFSVNTLQNLKDKYSVNTEVDQNAEASVTPELVEENVDNIEEAVEQAESTESETTEATADQVAE